MKARWDSTHEDAHVLRSERMHCPNLSIIRRDNAEWLVDIWEDAGAWRRHPFTFLSIEDARTIAEQQVKLRYDAEIEK